MLLAYTQFVMKTAMGQVERDSLELEAQRIERLIAATNNPALIECVLYLGAHLESAKRSILELSELQRRSLVYATLKPIHPKYSDAVIAALKASQLQYNEVWVRSLEAKGREELIFDATYVIERETSAGFFNLLEKRGEAVFSIPFNHPEFNRGGTSFVTVQQVDMTIDGIRTSNSKYTCRLSHLGNSSLADQNGQRFNFNHEKRITILSYALESGKWTPTFQNTNNLGGSVERYLFVSPFASWNLWFSPDDGVLFERVRQITFAFKARCIPANSPPLPNYLPDIVPR